ncbi:N/A [soil metagenome]
MPRKTIHSVFEFPGEHLGADEILDRVAKIDPDINRATVYRSLEVFRDLGIISETDLGGGIREYEIIEHSRHHHLVCHRCRTIIDLDDDLVIPLKTAILERYGFAPSIDHLAVFGHCASCSRR